MKHFLLLSALLILLAGCSKEDSTVAYNFSVLGIEKITIDKTVISLDSCGFPAKGSDSYAIVGYGYSNTSPIRSYDLVVWNIMPSEETISVKSKYEDISTEIEKHADSGFYNIIVSRKGFDEKIIYKIGFMQVLPSSKSAESLQGGGEFKFSKA
jgi:hypothetical protein